MTNLNEQMEMFDKEISEKKELNKLNKLFSKGVTSLKEQFSEEELKNKLERLKYLKNLYETNNYFKKTKENGGTRIISGNMSDKMAEQMEKKLGKNFGENFLGKNKSPLGLLKYPLGYSREI